MQAWVSSLIVQRPRSTFNWPIELAITFCFQPIWSLKNNFLWKSRMQYHPYHIVDPRPWPFTGAFGAFLTASGLSGWLHKFDKDLIILGLLLISLTIIQWWRDVRREATYLGKHTSKVENGLRLGMLLFIVSETSLFFSFFWAFFHSSLRPNIEIGSSWTPARLNTIDPFGVPLLNTTLLLSRGATITWAHISILSSCHTQAHVSFACTVLLGLVFTRLQVIEYTYSRFTMADSIYGRTFYLATGFHGVHVLVGTLFIVTIWGRHLLRHFSRTHHFGFEASAWYWHFVDVVWLFLFISIYWWGY